MINNKTLTQVIKVQGFSSGYRFLRWIYLSPYVCLDKSHEWWNKWISMRFSSRVWGRGEYNQMFYNNICSLLMVLLKIINNGRNWYHECSLSTMSQLYKYRVYIKFMVLRKSLLNTIKGLHFCNNMQMDHLIYLQTYQNKIPIGYLGSSKQNPFRSLLLTFL